MIILRGEIKWLIKCIYEELLFENNPCLSSSFLTKQAPSIPATEVHEVCKGTN